MTLVTPAHPVVLSIAGFDPSSGAGMTADLKTIAAHGMYGVSCITALTVQSTQGVREVRPVSRELIRETLVCLTDDVRIAGVKIGMLGSAAAAAEVAHFLRSGVLGPEVPVVLDPVIRSSSGAALLDPEGITVLMEHLLGLVTWITPNAAELAVLVGEEGLGQRQQRVRVEAAAYRLQQMAFRLGNSQLNIVVTGGDGLRPDDLLLTATGELHWLTGEHIATTSTHGTGCAYSTALVCRLIEGSKSVDAARQAKAYVEAALHAAYPMGKGKGPVNHLFAFDSK